MSGAPIQRVLVTGSSGHIGRTIIPALIEAGLEVNGLDVGPPSRGRPCVCPTTFGGVDNPDTVHAAMPGHDALIHLAANPNPSADLVNRLVGPNIIGLHNVLHAAVDHGVRRVVLASSVQAAGHAHHPRTPDLADQSADNWYGITKIVAEHAGMLFHKKYGLDVIAARIGWFPGHVGDARWMKTRAQQDSLLSRGDAVRFFLAATTAEWSGFHVLFAMSKPVDDADPEYDLQPGRDVLGYEPQDRFPDGLPGPRPQIASPASSSV
ncbi:MAG: NAD(P)-dependent oxidoreductase [Planctomycetota bacterium]